MAGSGKTFIGFARVPVDKATEYSAEDSDVTLRLWRVLKPRLAAEHMTSVYETLERPMVDVLARMERRGISIDRNILSRLSGEFAQDMARLEAEIYELAGETFNHRFAQADRRYSVRQNGPARRQEDRDRRLVDLGQRARRSRREGHEFAARILDWRQLSKLKSTYTDALPGFVNPETHRVHTSYALAATTTGRLSSSDPNLQNIPVRNEAGRKIRTAFVAEPGNALISADYSQIELRLLAHIADIPQLKQAFAEGLDIHAMTASRNVRRAGGGHAVGCAPPRQGDQFRHHLRHFGLRPRQPARHSARGSGRLYQEIFRALPRHSRLHGRDARRLCREQGYVTTMFGRKCHFPRIASSNPSERAFNERAAINAPIQGAAADIIRRAMVRMDEALAQAKLSARMLLQVHDELVFEAPDDEVEKTIAVVARDDRGAASGRVALRAAAGRRARRAELGRGALTGRPPLRARRSNPEPYGRPAELLRRCAPRNDGRRLRG